VIFGAPIHRGDHRWLEEEVTEAAAFETLKVFLLAGSDFDSVARFLQAVKILLRRLGSCCRWLMPFIVVNL